MLVEPDLDTHMLHCPPSAPPASRSPQAAMSSLLNHQYSGELVWASPKPLEASSIDTPVPILSQSAIFQQLQYSHISNCLTTLAIYCTPSAKIHSSPPVSTSPNNPKSENQAQTRHEDHMLTCSLCVPALSFGLGLAAARLAPILLGDLQQPQVEVLGFEVQQVL